MPKAKSALDKSSIICPPEPGRSSEEAEQPAESLDLHENSPGALHTLMKFYETGQGPDEEEAEVDLMVQLSGMVNRDWRIEDSESPEQVSR
jgi:hypothetical protein